jgi:NAD(P)-dependent dehydrogenase (short-subunit alcohol dehydrogenase family)
MDLKNKVVLITGAGKGAGKTLAEACAERGAIIAANDISPINVDDVVSGINASGGKAKSYVEDVAKKVGAQALIKSVEDDFGAIDVLIYHAEAQPRASLLEMDEWDWHRVLDVNLTGAFLMIQSVGRMMREKNRGAIINIAAGKNSRAKKNAAYLSSKAGLTELSRQADGELHPFGIHVHAVKNSLRVAQDVLSILEEQ